MTVGVSMLFIAFGICSGLVSLAGEGLRERQWEAVCRASPDQGLVVGGRGGGDGQFLSKRKGQT